MQLWPNFDLILVLGLVAKENDIFSRFFVSFLGHFERIISQALKFVRKKKHFPPSILEPSTMGLKV